MKKLRQDFAMIRRGLRELHSLRRGFLGWTIFRAAFVSLTPFINIYMSARIIDGIAQKAPANDLFWLAGITVALNFAVQVLRNATDRLISLRRFEFNARYEMRLNQAVIAMDYERVENPETHRHRQRINELRSVNNGGLFGLVEGVGRLCGTVFSLVFSISLAFTLFFSPGPAGLSGWMAFAASPWFAVLLGICIVANALFSMVCGQAGSKRMYGMLGFLAPFNRIANYYLEYITTYQAGKDIRIYHQQPLVEAETMALDGDARRSLGQISTMLAKYGAALAVSGAALSLLTYLFVGLRALAGLFGVGLVVQYIGSIDQFTAAFTNLSEHLGNLHNNNEALQVYFDYLDIPSRTVHGTLPVEKRALCDGGDNEYEIEFRDVCFRYPGSDTYALDHVSMKFKVGERLAAVGMNGSGKTTFIKLLCRLYDPTEGEIRLNGIDIKKYDYAEYLSLFSVVFQDFKLFSFSLGQNTAATVDYDAPRAAACLQESGFADRLEHMPAGLETCLYKNFDDKGVEISGGESQKIALARALYKDAPFIILDEPTAALDPLAEYEVYRNFNQIVGSKTAIYISHRLSSCRFCDTIAVFDQGRIIQRGPHATLAADKSGKYHELWHAQAQYYAEESHQ